MQYPKLRNIEAFPIESEGQKAICLRDPAQISSKIIAVPYDTFFVISLFDGKHSILDIQEAYTRQFGDLLFSNKINEIIKILDENLFLDNDNFNKHKQLLIEEFKQSPIRMSSHSGLSYPENSKDLNEYITGLFNLPDASGEPMNVGERRLTTVPDVKKKLSALIAPHIDFHRGGFCYTYSYKELAESELPDLFIILGVSHSDAKSLYIATKKDFITPLGTAETDKDFVDELVLRYKFDIFQDEFVHRNEHSIEFQVVFIQYIMQKYHRCSRNIKIVPILCSSFQQFYIANIQPTELPEVKDFVTAMKSIISERKQNICIVSGVDFSHIGRHFGDNFDLSPTIIQDTEKEDKELLTFIEKREKEKVFSSVQKDLDKRKICGLPSIYALLALLEGTNIKEGKLLKYAQAIDYQNQILVSFASMIFVGA